MPINTLEYFQYSRSIDTAITLGYVSIVIMGISIMVATYEVSTFLKEFRDRRQPSKLETELQPTLENPNKN